MTGDDEDYQNDVGRMKAGLSEVDFDQLTLKQIDAHDRKARKASSKGKRARPKTSDERPRLKIEKHSPDKTVADLRAILGAAGGLFDRGKIVKMVDDQTRGGSVAHVMTPAASDHGDARGVPTLSGEGKGRQHRGSRRCAAASDCGHVSGLARLGPAPAQRHRRRAAPRRRRLHPHCPRLRPSDRHVVRGEHARRGRACPSEAGQGRRRQGAPRHPQPVPDVLLRRCRDDERGRRRHGGRYKPAARHGRKLLPRVASDRAMPSKPLACARRAVRRVADVRRRRGQGAAGPLHLRNSVRTPAIRHHRRRNTRGAGKAHRRCADRGRTGAVPRQF